MFARLSLPAAILVAFMSANPAAAMPTMADASSQVSYLFGFDLDDIGVLDPLDFAPTVDFPGDAAGYSTSATANTIFDCEGGTCWIDAIATAEASVEQGLVTASADTGELGITFTLLRASTVYIGVTQRLLQIGGQNGDGTGITRQAGAGYDNMLLDGVFLADLEREGDERFLDLAAGAHSFRFGGVRASVTVGQNQSAPTGVPEPAAIALLGMGVLGLAGMRRGRI